MLPAESDSCFLNVRESDVSDMESSSEKDFGTILSVLIRTSMSRLCHFVGQYQDDASNVARQNEGVGADGISSQQLETRYGREKPIEDWCTCTK